MGRAKEIIVKVIPSKIANDFVKKHHYSGKVVPNSQLHFGAFLDGKLHGVMSYGPSLNKKGTINIVKNTEWNEFIELNRMAFDDYLPKNSESRCIAYSIKLIKKNAPQIRWIISFADGCQCGDGTIYRASNFKLINIKKNLSMWQNKLTGQIMQDMQFYHTMTKKDDNWERLSGNMLTYIYFIDKDKIKDLTVPIIPFSKIDELNAGMYKGEKITQAERHNKKEA
jgi:hypothetical protein